MQGTLNDEVDKLAKLRAIDERAGLVKSSAYPNVVPRIVNESWVLYLGPFDSEQEADAACVTFRKVHPDCRPMQLDP